MGDFSLAYLDGVLIFSKMLHEYIKHIRRRLKKLKVKGGPGKSRQKRVPQSLHCILSLLYVGKRTSTRPRKDQSHEPKLTDVKDLYVSLKLANYCQKIVSHYPRIAGALTELRGKAKEFLSTEGCVKTFQELRRHLTSASVLTIFNP
jgi:hypothetical protein